MSWKGYYKYDGTNYEMNFKNFNAIPLPAGNIQGEGSDEVGTFNFSGSFSPDAKQVRFVKQYYGTQTHAIYYEGQVTLNPPTISGYWCYSPGIKQQQFKIVYS